MLQPETKTPAESQWNDNSSLEQCKGFLFKNVL